MTTTTTAAAPRVELRKIKHATFASEETECFEAQVYINGVHYGSASNDGKGGCNMYHGVEQYRGDDLYDRLNAIAKTMPPVEFHGTKLNVDPDILVGDILAAELEKRRMKRLCARKVLFRIKSEAYRDGEWSTLKNPYTPAAKNYLVTKYGENLGEILNETLSA